MESINLPSRRTKIVCTVGPAIDKIEKLTELAKAGMNVVRLNFSHGSHDYFTRVIEDIRHIEKKIDRPLAIMADIQGPKLRVGKVQEGGLPLKAGTEVYVTTESVTGGTENGKTLIPTSYKDFIKDVGPGHRILLDDGLLALRVLSRESNTRLKCEVIDGGLLRENKGINVPEASFSAPAITEKDYEDILFALEQGVEFIAMSFVRSAQEVRHLKNFVNSRGNRTQILAKIEKTEALTNLDAIIDASDGVLVARGDLAVEVGNERVPVLQKKIIRKCNLRGKPVIIATQMLMSMVESPRPTRAEASDVANAIVDGADAVMLSNETAVGKYPVEAVQMMGKITQEMELEAHTERVLYNEWQLSPERELQIAILQSAVRLASVVEAKALVVVTQSGESSLLVSKCRPQTTVLAITGNLETYRQGALKWGVESLYMEDMENLVVQTSFFDTVGQRLLALGRARTGDRLVITAGLPRLAHGSTNTIKIHSVN